MICCDVYYMVSPYSWTEDAHDTVLSYLKYDRLWYVLHSITYSWTEDEHALPQSMNTVIPCNTYHILNTMPPYHTHSQSMYTVIPCNTYHNKSSVNKMTLKIINVRRYIRGSKRNHRIHGLRKRMLRCHRN
jgi:hypothetical protein